jgi:hypothetical protein
LPRSGERHCEGARPAGVNLDEGAAKRIRTLFDLEEIAAECKPVTGSGDAFPVLKATMGPQV